jgi:hypothetical protein
MPPTIGIASIIDIRGYLGSSYQKEDTLPVVLQRSPPSIIHRCFTAYRLEPVMSDLPRNILFKGGTIVTMDAEVPNLAVGDLLVRGNHIVAVGPNIDATYAEVIDAKGTSSCPVSLTRIIMHGLASCVDSCRM